MRLYCIHTDSHSELVENWFLASLPPEYDVRMAYCDATPGGSYRDEDWSRAIITKADVIVRAIDECRGEPFVYSDVDVQFFGRTSDRLARALGEHDIVCQRDDPQGNLCTGFFAARGSDRLHDLWQDVRDEALAEGRDQYAFNRLVREADRGLRWGYLPPEFFGAGCGIVPNDEAERSADGFRHWEPGMELVVPRDIVMHHANWTIGVDNKLRQLDHVRDIIETAPAVR